MSTDPLKPGKPALDLGPPRLLLVAYYFAPSSSVGALRWTRMSAELASAGYEIDVITLPSPLTSDVAARSRPSLHERITVHEVEPRQDSLLTFVNRLVRLRLSLSLRLRRSLGPDSPVERKPAGGGASLPPRLPPPVGSDEKSDWPATTGPPLPLTQPLSLIRGALGAWSLLREERRWVSPGLKSARALAREKLYDAVITSGPPHLAAMIGEGVAREHGIPFLADYRDPWTLDRVHKPSARWVGGWHVQRWHERKVVKAASAVIMNTDAAADAMRTAFPSVARRVFVVRNGSDPEDRRDSPHRDRFVVLYAGSLYLRRDPRLLFSAARLLIDECGLSPEQLQIRLIGNVKEYQGTPTRQLAEASGISDYVRIDGFLSRQQALTAASEASVLVCLPDGIMYNVQAKVYEYAQLEAWLLAFVARNSAMEQLLLPLGADLVYDESVEDAADRLARRWRDFSDGERPARLDEHSTLARRGQIERLVRVLSARGVPAPRPSD